MYPLKYIFGKSVMGAQMLIIWPAKARESHAHVAQSLFMVVSSAGFVFLKDGKLDVFGESESLRKHTIDIDKQFIADLDLAELHSVVLKRDKIPAMIWMKPDSEKTKNQIINRSLNNYKPISSGGVGEYLNEILQHYKRSA